MATSGLRAVLVERLQAALVDEQAASRRSERRERGVDKLTKGSVSFMVTFGKGLWRGVGEPLFSPCQKGINEFVSGSHVAELIQHKKVIDYTATIQWLPHSISTFFGLLRAFHAATLHHTAKRRLDHIQQPTVRL